MLPVFVEAVGGGVIVNVDGNSFIDLGSAIAVVGVGNAAPAVVDAVREQVGELTDTCFMVTPYEGHVAVREKLYELTPGEHPTKSALFNSGAAAVENAVKIARAVYTRRTAIVGCHAEGVVVLAAGSYGNVLRFLPPLVIPDHLLIEGLDALDAAFDAVTGRSHTLITHLGPCDS